MASGRFGNGGSLTPLGGGAASSLSDAGLHGGGSPDGSGDEMGRAGTPAGGDPDVAARLVAEGSKYTGAPRKTLSPLEAAGGLGALKRPSRGIVDRAGSSRDLAESLRQRSTSEAGYGTEPSSPYSPVARSRAASTPGTGGLGLSPQLLPMGGDSSVLGIEEEDAADLAADDDAEGWDSDDDGARALLRKPSAAAMRGAFGVGSGKESSSHRRSHVGGRLPVTNVPKPRFTHARRPVRTETLVVPTPGSAGGPVHFPADGGPAAQGLARHPSDTGGFGGGTAGPAGPAAAGGATGAAGPTPARGELRLVSKPTFHLHRTFQHIPDDPDVPSPVPEADGATGRGEAGAGRWERRGEFAERGDAVRAGGRGDDETSLTELAGQITDKVRQRSRDGKREVRVVHAGIDATTGVSTAARRSRGRSRESSTRPAHRGEPGPAEAPPPSADDGPSPAPHRRVRPPPPRPAPRDGPASPLRPSSPVRVSGAQHPARAKRKGRRKVLKPRARGSTTSAAKAAHAPGPRAGPSEAEAAAAQADMDDILGRASRKHRSAMGAGMREVEPAAGGRGAGGGRHRLDASGGGERLSHAGGRDARAFAVSTAGLGTSKSSAMAGEGFASSGIAALGSVAATLSSQLVEQDMARLAQAARTRRRQEQRDDAELVASHGPGAAGGGGGGWAAASYA